MTILSKLKITGTDEEGKINFSLAGVMIKSPAAVIYFIACGSDDVEGCGWKHEGEFQGTHFVVKSDNA